MELSISKWMRMRALKKRYTGQDKDPNRSADFRAVAIVPGLIGCCAEAKALSDTRFLARNSPALPLPDCDMSSCECRYEKYADRRLEPRRHGELGIASKFVREEERREKKRGRRSTDE